MARCLRGGAPGGRGAGTGRMRPARPVRRIRRPPAGGPLAEPGAVQGGPGAGEGGGRVRDRRRSGAAPGRGSGRSRDPGVQGGRRPLPARRPGCARRPGAGPGGGGDASRSAPGAVPAPVAGDRRGRRRLRAGAQALRPDALRVRRAARADRRIPLRFPYHARGGGPAGSRAWKTGRSSRSFGAASSGTARSCALPTWR